MEVKLQIESPFLPPFVKISLFLLYMSDAAVATDVPEEKEQDKENPCFSPGKLYVACSRVGEPSNLFVLAKDSGQYGLRERKPKVLTPTTLKYTDTGELMALLSSLGYWDCARIHLKINEYFGRSMGAVPIIIENIRSNNCKVRVIGTNILEEIIEFQPKCFPQNIEEGIFWLKRSEMEGVLCCQLEQILSKDYRQKFHNCLVVPFTTKNVVFFYIALVNVRKFFRCEEFYCGVVTECLRHCIGVLLSVSNYEEMKLYHDECRDMVAACSAIISSMGTDLIYEEIQKQSMSIIGASNSILYLLDANSDPHYKSSIINSEELAINKDENKLATRHVIKSGKAFVCANLHDEPLYGYCRSATPPRNSLSFTISSGSGLSLALLELYEKTGLGFSRLDVDRSQTLSTLAFAGLSAHDKYMSFVKGQHKLAFTDCFFLRRVKMNDDSLVGHVIECNVPHNYPRFSDMRFDPPSIPEDHIICVCFKIFQGMGLLKTFLVKKEKFARFLLCVKNAYNTLPFHNWTQGFATFHFVFSLINSLNLIQNKYITLLEAFALLLAGLCHCLDSRGTTTIFTMVSGTVQGSLFSSPGSLAQMYYSSQTLRLMNFSECNFFENLSDDMFHSFAVLLIDMIKGGIAVGINLLEKLKLEDGMGFYNFLRMNSTDFEIFLQMIGGKISKQQTVFRDTIPPSIRLAVTLQFLASDTDMTNNLKKVMALDNFSCNEYDFNNWKHRRLIHNIIMNVSQLNFIVKPWSYCRQIGENCFHAFFRKGDLSHATDVYEIADLNEDILKLPEISMQFIEHIGLPTFKAFAKTFPIMSWCLPKINSNLKKWEEEKEIILATMTKEALGTGGGEGDEIVLINPFKN